MFSNFTNKIFGKKGFMSIVFLAATTFAAPAYAQERSSVIHVDKTFNMEVQKWLFTNPRDSDSRNVPVQCSKLTTANGRANMTGEFATQFDPPPKNIPYGITSGSAILEHIGNLQANGITHQICVASSEINGPKAKNQTTDYFAFSRKGRDYYTSVPMKDGRYCPVMVAFAKCTKTDNDNNAIDSSIYKELDNGDLILDKNVLKNVKNPPDYSNYSSIRR